MQKPIEEILAEINERLKNIERYTLAQTKEMLTIEECAIFLNTSKRHVYRLTSGHKIPYYKPNGKLMYFDKKDLTEWLKRNRVATEEEAEQEAIAYCVRNRH